MIVKPIIAHSAQSHATILVENNSISEQTKMSFHLTHITMEVHRVQPKRFPAHGTFGANHAFI
jgi:hypothetical protein